MNRPPSPFARVWFVLRIPCAWRKTNAVERDDAEAFAQVCRERGCLVVEVAEPGAHS